MISKRIVLHFPHRLVDQPIVYKLVKEYDLQFNILKAYVTPQEEGLMVLELSGEDENFNKGIEYLQSSGVKIQPLSQDVIRNEVKCTDCGVCVPSALPELCWLTRTPARFIFMIINVSPASCA